MFFGGGICKRHCANAQGFPEGQPPGMATVKFVGGRGIMNNESRVKAVNE